MTTPDLLAERRDQALRDMVELDRQVAAGEVDAAEAEGLRARYEQDAADAVQALRAPVPAPAPPRRRSRATRLAYVTAGLAAAVAAGVLLPPAVRSRPPGGFVTGNEMGATAAATPAATAPPAPARMPNLADISDAELEAAVAANPDVAVMRLALANRYTDEGRYGEALVHYRRVLELDPGNAQATARTGWILLQSGQPQQAAQLVAAARRADPSLLEALWFDANIRLYGMNDPAGALAVLAEMRARPNLPASVAQQVSDLEAQARSTAAARP